MRQHRGVVVAGISRLGGRRRIHGIGIELALDVEYRDDPNAAERAIRRHDHAVLTHIRGAPQQPVALVGRASAPAFAAVFGHDVDETGNGLAVARGETVGRE